MATIKSYTDLYQSKKLAEILPLESADMYYFDDNGGEPSFKVRNGITYYYDSEDCLCCWSLAALIGILPRVDIEKEICSDDTYDYRVKAYIGDGYIGDWYNNPVDACVTMIENLHELKII